MDLTSKSRFAILTTSQDGPYVTFWDTWRCVIEILTRYNRAKCADDVSVWHRTGPNRRWVCLTDF